MIGDGRKEEIGPQLETALSILEHYHSEHTNDKITRFVNKGMWCLHLRFKGPRVGSQVCRIHGRRISGESAPSRAWIPSTGKRGIGGSLFHQGRDSQDGLL